MLMPSSIRNLFHLPSRIALLLGLGALSITGAKADTGGELRPDRDGARMPQQSARPLADLTIWQENGRIYVSEAGKPAEELRLGSTAEAESLMQLLGQKGATATAPHVLRDRVILVGGGGQGFNLESQRPDGSNQTRPATNRATEKHPAMAKAGEQAGTAQPPSGATDGSK
jgi:hypothetical protein